MSEIKFLEDGIPEGYDKYEIVLSGNSNMREDKAEISLYAAAESYAHAAGYAQELADAKGYTSVSISSEREAKEREEAGYYGYAFSFPEEEQMMVVEAPELGSEVPQTVIVISDKTVEDLFDLDKVKQRERKRALAEREERRGRATPLSNSRSNNG